VKKELQAFAGDAAGSRLPDQSGPWHAIGVVRPDKDPLYNLSRDKIQRTIRVRWLSALAPEAESRDGLKSVPLRFVQSQPVGGRINRAFEPGGLVLQFHLTF
jgi:hypothetical protein